MKAAIFAWLWVLCACVETRPTKTAYYDATKNLAGSRKWNGPCTYYYVEIGAEGLPVRRTKTEGGKMAGLARARGSYFEDKQVERWRYYYEEPHEVRWLTRFNDSGQLNGPSTFYHSDGQKQAEGSFRRGLETGEWTFFSEEGVVTARGSYEKGRRDGKWEHRTPSGALAASCRWDDGNLVESSLRFFAEDGSARTQTPELRALVERRPVVPVQAEPQLTRYEETIIVGVVDWFLNEDRGCDMRKALNADADRQGGGPPYSGGDLRTKRFREGKQSELVGDDIGDILVVSRRDRGQRTIGQILGRNPSARGAAVVILRGMSGEVCEYCIAQWTSLVATAKKFEELQIQLIVVYPGDQQRADQFAESAEAVWTKTGDALNELLRDRLDGPIEGVAKDLPPAIEFAFDPDLRLVEALEVEDDLAMPTTLITDPSGKVLHAWVGAQATGRPSGGELFEELDRVLGAGGE